MRILKNDENAEVIFLIGFRLHIGFDRYTVKINDQTILGYAPAQKNANAFEHEYYVGWNSLNFSGDDFNKAKIALTRADMTINIISFQMIIEQEQGKE